MDRYSFDVGRFHVPSPGRFIPALPSFFISTTGTRLIHRPLALTFRALVTSTGVGSDSPLTPRIHDFRHTFAVRSLLGWYRTGQDVEARLLHLATYLGHRDPRSTYWYLSGAPELLALAAERLDAFQREHR